MFNDLTDNTFNGYLYYYSYYTSSGEYWTNYLILVCGDNVITIGDMFEYLVIENAIIQFVDESTLYNFINNYAIEQTPIFSYCDKNVIESVEQKNVSNTFYDSIDSVVQSPYFSWAYDSFLVAPFTYIVSLFSMPTNSPVVLLMSYWLAISIIWLVFDLVMYVPLLVHRWLDKGVLE